MTTWQPLPWQMPLWRRFRKLIEHNKLTHAVMLSGLEGVGKVHFARALAQGLYCETPLEEGVACGNCSSCHQFQAGMVSDFRWLDPEEDASSISVDQIRDTIVFLELSRDRGRKKIALVSPAHLLTINAANSLLKTLEEPPGDALIMLLTSQPERLLITVRSRCQVFNLPVPGLKDGQAWLATQGLHDSGLAMDVCGHAPLAAKLFCENNWAVPFHALLESLVWNFSGSRSSHEIIAIWHGFDLEQLLVWMVLVSEWMILQGRGEGSLARHSRELADVAANSPLEQQLHRHDRLLQMKRQRGVSVNRDLVLDQLQILWSVNTPKSAQAIYRR